MKTKALSVILTCANLFLVQGLDSTNSDKDAATNSTRRIYFGTEAVPSDFPYFTFLDIGGAIGGGAIIADQWILTAAHVPYNTSCTKIKIYPAAWNPDEFVQPVECYPHPEYKPGSYAYDVGLLKIQENFLQDGRAKTVPLPPPNTRYAPGLVATIVGRGITQTGNPPEHLLRAQLRVKDWEFCNEIYKEDLCKSIPRCLARDMPTRVICTQGEGNPAPSTCFGDSGGPVLINGEVAGVVSFGVPNKHEFTCQIGSPPSMQASVVDYLPWIYSYIAPDMDTSRMQVRPENPWR